jgi:hypothetical protein
VTVPAFDPLTFVTSVAGSLVVAWIGVRYFTGAKINAERADAARRELRILVAPWLSSARARAEGRGRNLQRELRVAHADDGVCALAVLRIAADLPWWRRVLVRRRCRAVFGEEWFKLADERVDTAPGDGNAADYMLTRALFLNRGTSPYVGTGTPRVPFSTGLMQRVYSSNVDGDAQILVSELVKLSRGR